MTHVGQADEDTVAFFDESRHVRVPGEVLVEHYAKVSHHRALTDRILAKLTGDRSQILTILTGAESDEFSFTGVDLQTVKVKPGVQRVQNLFHNRTELIINVLVCVNLG